MCVTFQPFNVLMQPINAAKANGLNIDSCVLDVSNVDVSVSEEILSWFHMA